METSIAVPEENHGEDLPTSKPSERESGTLSFDKKFPGEKALGRTKRFQIQTPRKNNCDETEGGKRKRQVVPKPSGAHYHLSLS